MRLNLYRCDGCSLERGPSRKMPKGWLFQKPHHFCPACAVDGTPDRYLSASERYRRELQEANRKRAEKWRSRPPDEWFAILEMKRKRREAMARGEEPPGATEARDGTERPPRVISQKTRERMAAKLEENQRLLRWHRAPLNTSSEG